MTFHDFFHDRCKFSKTLGLAVSFKNSKPLLVLEHFLALNSLTGTNSMALYPRQNSTFAFDVPFTFYVCCPRFDIRVWQCDIELATLEFHNATLKFDNKTLIFHATFKLRVFNFTPTIRHAQLSFYARFNMLVCHFMLVLLFNSRHA